MENLDICWVYLGYMELSLANILDTRDKRITFFFFGVKDILTMIRFFLN